VTPTIIPYFKRVVPHLRLRPRLTSGTPARNTKSECGSELDSDSGYGSDDYSDYLL
jgi:hypothetical protein